MAWRAGGGCKSFLCVLVFFVAVCSFSHCTEPARSQTSNSVKLKGHGTFSQNHSKADSSGRLIIGRSPLKGAILKEVKFANNPLDYQSDPAWEAPAHVYGTASYDRASAQKLLQMNPKVECTPEAMKLMVLDPGSTPGSLFVDRGSLLAPLPLSKLPTSCGYSLTSARRHLILVAPYDGCFVTQEDDCYVLPLQWCGLPVRMSCPAVKQSNPPVVSCRAEGMVVTMEWIVSVSDIKVKLNDQWEPLMKVSSTCGFSVVAHSEGVVISARYAPCVQMKDGMFTFGLSGNGEIKVACPPQLKPAQSPNQQVPSSPWSLHPVPPTLAPPFNQFPLYPWLLQPPVTKPHKTHQVDQPDQSKPDGLPLIPDEKPVQHKPAILSPVTHAPRGPEQQPIYPYPLSTQQPTYEYEYPPDFSPEPTTEPPVINPPEMHGPPVTTPPKMPFYFPQTPPVNENPGEMYFDFSPEPTTEPPVINPPEMPFYFPQTPPVNENPGEMYFDFSPEPTTEPPVINPPEMPFYFPQTPPVNENPGEMQFDFSPEPTTEPPVINPPEMHGDFSQPPQITADSDTQTPQSGITYNSPVLCPENCISGFSHCCPSISFHQHYHYSVCPGGSQHEAPPYQPKDQPQAAVNTILKLYNQFYDLQPKVLYGESSDVNDHTETKPIYYNTYDQQKDYFVQNDEPVEDLWLSASEHQHSYMQDFGGLPTSDDDDPSKTHKPVHRHNKSLQHEHPVDSNSEPDGYEGGKDKLFKSQPRASYPVPLPNEDDQLPINQELTESASLAYPVPNGHNSPTLTPKPSLSPSNTSLKPEPPESLKDERKSKTQLGSIPSVPPQVSGQPSQTQDSELEAYHQSKGQKRTN